MAKIRTIKPEMKSSETVSRLSISARLLFIWLITEADDEGRLLDNAKTLSGTCFPFDEDIETKDVAGWLEEIELCGLIRRYRAEEKSVIQIVGWSEHQKIQPSHKSKSLLPAEETQSTPRRAHKTTKRAAQIQDADDEEGQLSEEPPADFDDVFTLEPAAAPVRTRRVDEVFEAVCAVCARDTKQMTKSARGATNRAVSELKAVGATSEEIYSRAKVYRQKYPNIDLSPTALAKHWDSLVVLAARQTAPQTPSADDLRVRVQMDPSELDESKWPTLGEIRASQQNMNAYAV